MMRRHFRIKEGINTELYVLVCELFVLSSHASFAIRRLDGDHHHFPSPEADEINRIHIFIISIDRCPMLRFVVYKLTRQRPAALILFKIEHFLTPSPSR